MRYCGIRSIDSIVTDEKYFDSFVNRMLTVPLFWYWSKDTINNAVNDEDFRQSDHFETIYRYAGNKLKVWLQDIDDLSSLRVPTFDDSQYRVPTSMIECKPIVGKLIYDCEFKLQRAYRYPSTLASINDKKNQGSVETDLVTAENEFWVANYNMTPESLASNQSTNSTFEVISSIDVNIKDMQYGYTTKTPLELKRIPRTVKSFMGRNFWKTVATNDMNNHDQQGTLLLSDLPPRITNFVLDGATEFNGTISFGDLPISTETVAFINSQVSRISMMEKIDLRSQLKSVSVLSQNLKGYLDLQFFECYTRNIRTTFKFYNNWSEFRLKNDREYHCILDPQ